MKNDVFVIENFFSGEIKNFVSFFIIGIVKRNVWLSFGIDFGFVMIKSRNVV